MYCPDGIPYKPSVELYVRCMAIITFAFPFANLVFSRTCKLVLISSFWENSSYVCVPITVNLFISKLLEQLKELSVHR